MRIGVPSQNHRRGAEKSKEWKLFWQRLKRKQRTLARDLHEGDRGLDARRRGTIEESERGGDQPKVR